VPVLFGLATGDELHAWQVLGIVLAMGGAALAARQGQREEATDRRYADPRASAIWAAASAVAFGVFLTALPSASDDSQAWALLDARLALVVLLLAWAGKRLAEVPLGRPSFLLSVPGLLLVLGTALYATAPYLHNGSVPSLLALLAPAKQRPVAFPVGAGGFVLDTRVPGNSNSGHDFGTHLSGAQKADLVAFLNSL